MPRETSGASDSTTVFNSVLETQASHRTPRILSSWHSFQETTLWSERLQLDSTTHSHSTQTAMSMCGEPTSCSIKIIPSRTPSGQSSTIRLTRLAKYTSRRSQDKLSNNFHERRNNVLGIESVRAVRASRDLSAIVSSKGELLLWGSNEHGQLGCGQLSSNHEKINYILIPISNPYFKRHKLKVVDVRLGSYHSLAITQD